MIRARGIFNKKFLSFFFTISFFTSSPPPYFSDLHIFSDLEIRLKSNNLAL